MEDCGIVVPSTLTNQLKRQQLLKQTFFNREKGINVQDTNKIYPWPFKVFVSLMSKPILTDHTADLLENKYTCS